MSKTLYVIDGHSQTYMAYHAMGNLTAPDGRPTGAVYGFVNMLRKLLKEHTPDHLVIAFDHFGTRCTPSTRPIALRCQTTCAPS